MEQTKKTQSIQFNFASLQLQCTITDDYLIINGQDKIVNTQFYVKIKNNKLPASFNRIFDSVQDFLCFLKTTKHDDLELIRNLLRVKVKINNFQKFITVDIPVETRIIENSSKHTLDIKTLKQKVESLQQEVINLKQQLQKSFRRQSKLESKVKDYQRRIQALEKRGITQKEVKVEVINLSDQSIRTQNNTTVGISKSFQAAQQKTNPLISSNQDIKTHCNIPLQRLKSITSKKSEIIHKDNSFVQYDNLPVCQGRKNNIYYFEIDRSNPNLDAFIITRNYILRKNIKNDMPFQIYSLRPFPQKGRFSYSFLIHSKSPNSISLGLITQQQKQLNCIRQQTPAIMMGCDNGYELYIDGRPKKAMLQGIKAKTIVQFTIQLSTRRLKITKNNQQSQPIRLQLPEHFTKKRVYPFIQMMCADDSIEVNST